MKKLFFFFLVGFFFCVSPLWAQKRCVNPSLYLPDIEELFLPCVKIGQSNCFFANLYLESTQPQVVFRILSLNATDISPDQIDNYDMIAYYDTDNQTLDIPIVFLQNQFYSAKLQLAILDKDYALILKEVRPSSQAIYPVCWDDPHFNPDIQSGQGTAPFEKLIYSRRVWYQDMLIECYEYIASAEKIAILRSLPVSVIIGPTTIQESFEGCPHHFDLGCFTYNEDGDFMAIYYYPNPFSDIITPLSCGENYFPVPKWPSFEP